MKPIELSGAGLDAETVKSINSNFAGDQSALRALRDKVNLDIFWLRDESLEDSANLPDPDVLAAEIMADLRAALDQFSSIAGELSADDQPEP